MTVQQLIDTLLTVSPDLDVYVDDTPLASIEVHYKSMDNVDLVTIDGDKIIVLSSNSNLPQLNLN